MRAGDRHIRHRQEQGQDGDGQVPCTRVFYTTKFSIKNSLFLVRGHLHLAPALGGGGYGDSPRAHALTRVAHHPPLYSAAEKFAIEAS